MGTEDHLRVAPDEQQIASSPALVGSVPDIAFIVETYQTATGCQKPLSQEIRKFPFTTGSGIKIQYIQK
jgi:hypothetical protein